MNALELKENRRKLKLSQEELGDKLGLSKNTIYNYENGGVIPKSKVKILTRFFEENLNIGISKNNKNKISKDFALQIIDALYLHSDELMSYENFALWVESIKAEERNDVLKNILRKRLGEL